MKSVGTGAGRWVRASRCTPNNNCVELRLGRGVVGVRDSKNRVSAPLVFERDEWTTFLEWCRS